MGTSASCGDIGIQWGLSATNSHLLPLTEQGCGPGPGYLLEVDGLHQGHLRLLTPYQLLSPLHKVLGEHRQPHTVWGHRDP